MSAEMREAAASLCEGMAESARRTADSLQLHDARGCATASAFAVAYTHAAAAIRALPLPDAWQDISTAPTDGTPVLLWFPRSCWRRGSGVEKCCHDQGMWVTDFGEEARLYWDDPTHWMPLPAPPQENTT